jgi:hypothetical protein
MLLFSHGADWHGSAAHSEATRKLFSIFRKLSYFNYLYGFADFLTLLWPKTIVPPALGAIGGIEAFLGASGIWI